MLGWIILATKEGLQNKFKLAGDSIECLAFSPTNEFRVLAYGTLEGYLHILDIIKCNLRLTCPKLLDACDGYSR